MLIFLLGRVNNIIRTSGTDVAYLLLRINEHVGTIPEVSY